MLEDIRGEGWRCLSLHMRKAHLTYTKAWVAWMTVHLYQYAEHHLNAVLAAFATGVHNNPQRVLELGVLLDAPTPLPPPRNPSATRNCRGGGCYGSPVLRTPLAVGNCRGLQCKFWDFATAAI